MPIPCLPTETSFDVRCPVCGRGFLLLSAPTLLLQRWALRRAARRALATQHDVVCDRSETAHPNEVFDLPGWDEEPETGASSWGLSGGFCAGEA